MSAVTVGEIRWAFEPGPAPDVRGLTDAGLLALALGESRAYRLLAQQALHALHIRDQELRRVRAAHSRLLTEFRSLRAQPLRASEVA